MRARILGLSLLLAFAVLAAVRLPIPATQDAAATHFGIIECAEVGNPVSDGTISPGEFDESYFDETTKILVYFTCDNSTQRELHVGIVAPGDGWVGLEVQARDTWDGTLNEVRLSRAPATDAVQVEDGLRNVTLGSFESDTLLGGTVDVLNVTAGTAGAAAVYEFCVPLRSADPADSQLTTNGPFYFALEDNPTDSDLNSIAMASSDLQTFVLETSLSVGTWTSMELSLAPAEPTADSRLLLALRDVSGYPLPGRTLEAFVETTFGYLSLGPVSTNDQGVAEVTYAPRDNGTFVVGAAYAGGGGFLGSVVWKALEIAPAYGGGDLGLGFFDPIGAFELRPIEAIVVVVVGSVWATYAYAIFVTRQALRPAGTEISSTKPSARSWRRWSK